ncbi:MalY/PatB family protein [Schaalia sp. Marseille-Q2122]|uniref:MalY/PatB family protein n=1 Tax=Schaalia sp. Marseille-Q2122 TaxID=2736604 RepID=UPI00158E6262|nr:aminotransferase class I/II-fold pyridoxal phosphate-dependent enzyme [Schaalia sp. Marseille-Q2122]
MSVRTYSAAQMRQAGSLKWTGITRADGSPTLGAWVAEMDFGTAPVVEEAIIGAIRGGFTGYQPTWLAPRLAEATAAYQSAVHGWQVEAGAIRPARSVLGALALALDTVVPAGAAVIVPTPAYMPFLTIPPAHGHPVIEVPALYTPGNGAVWALDLERIRRACEAGAGMLILCNPWNPTGRVLSEAELRALHAVLADYEVVVFSDEIHAPLVMDDSPFISYASLGPESAAHTVTAVAASKGWNIAALPCAQVILPDEALRERWMAADDQLAHEMNSYGALAAIAAYETASSPGGEPWLEEVKVIVRGNFDMLDEAFYSSPTSDSALCFHRPQATYLTWWDFSALCLEGDASPDAQLREVGGVSTNAGRSLGAGFERWARINVGCAPETAGLIVEAINATYPGMH